MIKRILLVFFLLLICPSFTKIIVMTSAYNRPEFIKLQYETFKKFLKDDYEYIVFSDADDNVHKIAIENECKNFGIRHIPIPQEIHKIENNLTGFHQDLAGRSLRSVFRQGDVLTYMFNYYADYNDLIMIIDSDIFMVRPASLREIIADNHIASAHCIGACKPLKILTPGPEIAIFDMPKLIHKECMILKAGFVGTTFLDPFHFLQYYLKSHPETKLKALETQMGLIELAQNNEFELQNKGFLDHEINFIYNYAKIHVQLNIPTDGDYASFYEKNKTFCNYNHGSNWNSEGQQKVDLKTKLFLNFINLVLNLPEENFYTKS